MGVAILLLLLGGAVAYALIAVRRANKSMRENVTVQMIAAGKEYQEKWRDFNRTLKFNDDVPLEEIIHTFWIPRGNSRIVTIPCSHGAQCSPSK